MATDPKRATPGRHGPWLLGLLVLGLAGLVIWSLPKGPPADATDGGAPDGSRPRPSFEDEVSRGRLPRVEANAEFAILTNEREARLRTMTTAAAIADKLDVRYCGIACDAVRTALLDKNAFEVEIRTSEDWILPPKDTMDVVAPGLSPSERAHVHDNTWVVVVRAHGPPSIDQVPARTGFAAAAIVADMLGGLVYDEVRRRIEKPAAFREHVITVPIGTSVFAPDHVVVQLYTHDDGLARAVTLGMNRFGSADFVARGSAVSDGPLLVSVLDAVAAKATGGEVDVPVKVTLADVAKGTGRKIDELSKEPSSSLPVAFDVAKPERAGGDPDNDLVEIVPSDGATPAGWASATTRLFGASARVIVASSVDPELLRIGEDARRSLDTALAAHRSGEGPLYVKAPFPAADGGTNDGGLQEWMWIEVTSCDPKTCVGKLTNTPTYATQLTLGSSTKVERRAIGDWMLRLQDGGASGGRSVRVLGGR